MIPIKILCECGQKYAFEVEPVNGRMAAAVACPVCGVDGTEAANAVIAESVAAQPPLVPTAPPRVRVNIATPTPPTRAIATPVAAPVAAPATAPRNRPLLPGEVEPEQAKIQARAKIFWGDPQEDVTKYLMIQRFSPAEASALAGEYYKERVSALRGIGRRKIFLGIAYMSCPVLSLIIFAQIGFFILYVFVAALIVGVWGAWTFLRGWLMLLSPKSETGEVADDNDE